MTKKQQQPVPRDFPPHHPKPIPAKPETPPVEPREVLGLHKNTGKRAHMEQR